MTEIIKKLKIKIANISVLKKIAFSFAAVILMGALLLMLPISSRDGHWSPFLTALFTSATSTCVTGLVVVDTYEYWSLFGQLVILTLIQIGGVGFITLAISAFSLLKKKIGLRQRLAAREISGASHVAGMVKTTRFIICGTLTVELTGAFLLSFSFVPKLGVIRGIYYAVFHSVSAFCNAGIDLMSRFKPGSSLITVQSDPLFTVTIMLLIIVGGLGFLVWEDLIKCRLHFKKYRLHTKIVVTTTLLLIFGGAAIIYLFEMNGQAFSGLSAPDAVNAAFFQSVTTRTAGFFSVDLPSLRESTMLVMCVLMLIGGSPGSTAGGIKTTSFAVLFMSVALVFKNKDDVECFRRRVNKDALHSACCLLMLFLSMITASATIISFIDNVPIIYSLFECTSAMATVGLSMGITPELSEISKCIIIIMMYIGRVGALTTLLSFSRKGGAVQSKYVEEKITVG